MINGKRVLAVVPARGGSKGLPRKNILDLGGKPLLVWSLAAGAACPEVDRTILSSEDAEIRDVARRWGGDVPFRRPAELASDQAATIPVLLHALETLEAGGESYDYLVLLQATSPLREADEITACLQMCETSGAPACVTVSPTHQSPYYMYRLDDAGRMDPLLKMESHHIRRQDLPAFHQLDGSVYVARVPWLRENQTFLTDQTRACITPSGRALDIDSLADLIAARAILAAREQDAAS